MGIRNKKENTKYKDFNKKEVVICNCNKRSNIITTALVMSKTMKMREMNIWMMHMVGKIVRNICSKSKNKKDNISNKKSNNKSSSNKTNKNSNKKRNNSLIIIGISRFRLDKGM